MRFAFFVLLTGAMSFANSLPSRAAASLSLAEAQRVATTDAPQLAAQAATLRAVQQSVITATEQADPKLIIGVDNLPVDTSDRFSFTRDFMTMRKIGFMQEFTRGEKLKLRGERAEAEVRKEAAVLSLTEVNLRRDVALAWIERYFAERNLDLLTELARESELQMIAAQASLSGGKGQVSDPLAQRLAIALVADRTIDAARTVAKAKANLGRWIGVVAKQTLDVAPAFDELAAHHSNLIRDIDSHPHLAIYTPMAAMAQSEVQLANAAKHPDWSLEVAYAQRGPAFSNMLSINVRIDLPIFQRQRQDPAIAAKLALSEQIRAQTEDARRAHLAEIESLLVDWDSAKQRIAKYQADLLPLAKARTDIALAAYRGGKGDLALVLDARKGEIDMRMNQLAAQAEMARAWANLNFLTLPTAAYDAPKSAMKASTP